MKHRPVPKRLWRRLTAMSLAAVLTMNMAAFSIPAKAEESGVEDKLFGDFQINSYEGLADIVFVAGRKDSSTQITSINAEGPNGLTAYSESDSASARAEWIGSHENGTYHVTVEYEETVTVSTLIAAPPHKEPSAEENEKTNMENDLPVQGDAVQDAPVQDDVAQDVPAQNDAAQDAPEQDDVAQDVPAQNDAAQDAPEQDDVAQDAHVQDDAAQDVSEQDGAEAEGVPSTQPDTNELKSNTDEPAPEPEKAIVQQAIEAITPAAEAMETDDTGDTEATDDAGNSVLTRTSTTTVTGRQTFTVEVTGLGADVWGIEINEENFPDFRFRANLQQYLDRDYEGTPGYGWLSDEERTLRDGDATNVLSEVFDFTGIRYLNFDNISVLGFSNTSLYEIDLSEADLSNLEEVYLEDCPFTQTLRLPDSFSGKVSYGHGRWFIDIQGNRVEWLSGEQYLDKKLVLTQDSEYQCYFNLYDLAYLFDSNEDELLRFAERLDEYSFQLRSDAGMSMGSLEKGFSDDPRSWRVVFRSYEPLQEEQELVYHYGAASPSCYGFIENILPCTIQPVKAWVWFLVRESDKSLGKIGLTEEKSSTDMQVMEVSLFRPMSDCGIQAFPEEGAHFDGWYKDDGEKVDLTTLVADYYSVNQRYEARFSTDAPPPAVMHTVTFRVRDTHLDDTPYGSLQTADGQNGDVVTIQVADGQKIPTGAVTTLPEEKCKFGGWCQTYWSGTTVDDLTDITVDKDMTFIGHFYPDNNGNNADDREELYVVPFYVWPGQEAMGDVDGGKYNPINGYTGISVPMMYGAALGDKVPTVTVNPGYHFVGWAMTTPADTQAKWVTNLKDFQITPELVGQLPYFWACFAPDEHTVIYQVADGQKAYGSIDKTGAAVTHNTAIGDQTAVATANFGYRFDGWYKGGIKIADLSAEVITADATYEARFSKIPLVVTNHMVSFVVRSGDESYGAISAKSITVEDGRTIPAAVVVAAPNFGCRFDGWYKDGVKVTDLSTEVITADVTYEARFSLIPPVEVNHTVTFVVRSGDEGYGTVSKASITVMSGATIPAGAISASPAGSRDSFLGWYKDGVQAADLFSEVITADVTYEARFSHRSGGGGGGGSKDPEPPVTPPTNPEKPVTPPVEPEKPPVTPTPPVKPVTPVEPATPPTQPEPPEEVTPQPDIPAEITPAAPAPVTPVPAKPTPADTTPALVDPVPDTSPSLDVEITPDGEAPESDAEVVITPENEDGRVQQPDFGQSDEHKCCILHFLILLIALMVELVFMHKRKKHQEEEFEMQKAIQAEEVK